MITLRNPGLIDLDAIRIMGVNVKETDSPIGYFGTGLKFAIATLLRTGHKVILWRGEERIEFSAQPIEIRGKVFQTVYMGEEKLAFTTDLGKNWEVWMAFREIYSNMLDEGGHAQSSRIKPAKGQTLFEIHGEAFAKCYALRDEIFLNKPLLDASAEVSVHEGMSNTVFYRGVRVHRLEKPSFFTYNLEGDRTLTEDRTLAYAWSVDNAVSLWLRKHASEQDLMKIIEEAGEEFFERNIFMPDTSPSPTFRRVLAREINNSRLPKNWRPLAKLFKEEDEGQAFETFELSSRQEEKLDRALTICDALGCSLLKSELTFVRSLGNNVFGLCDKRQIYLAETVFDWGISTLAATIYEEFLHRDHDLEDNSRTMQNFLLQKIISLVE